MAKDYFKHTTRSRLDKSINTLLGILEGIAIDQTVSIEEWNLLAKWVEENQDLAQNHPYNEIIPRLIAAMSDGSLGQDEHQDMLWLCDRFRSTGYYNIITADIQRLQAILAAITADKVITETELEKLTDWLGDHDHLRTCWPFDEVDALITTVMQDRWIDLAEQKMLMQYFQSFTPADFNFDIPRPGSNTLQGICAVAPEITFTGKRFCFTGESHAPRSKLESHVTDRGGIVIFGVSPKLNYLVVGSGSNPCWAYACYGRKIEKAMQLRRDGANIVIAHEIDFFDSL